MNAKAYASLAPYTTFHIGGPARFLIEAHNDEDIKDTIAFARDQHLPLCPLGGGSNLLVRDQGVEGVVLWVKFDGITFEINEDETLCIAGAGVPWDTVVDAVGARGIFGIENLAGIPGTVGGAAVQNIGAYGAELAQVFAYADTINMVTGEHGRIEVTDAAFAYRTSLFKQRHDLLITQVAVRLKKNAKPNFSYADLSQVVRSGALLATSIEIARAVRSIRAQKFPQDPEEGTAGSFFKNPIISLELSASLSKHFPGLPTFPQPDGQVKIALAWVLDHVLSLKGYSTGEVRLYEKQPLVIVARPPATAADVDTFAQDIAERVFKTIGVSIEREVETFGEFLS
jgi:UDP-N-acetylmuramate dehydrogenase